MQEIPNVYDKCTGCQKVFEKPKPGEYERTEYYAAGSCIDGDDIVLVDGVPYCWECSGDIKEFTAIHTYYFNIILKYPTFPNYSAIVVEWHNQDCIWLCHSKFRCLHGCSTACYKTFTDNGKNNVCLACIKGHEACKLVADGHIVYRPAAELTTHSKAKAYLGQFKSIATKDERLWWHYYPWHGKASKGLVEFIKEFDASIVRAADCKKPL